MLLAVGIAQLGHFEKVGGIASFLPRLAIVIVVLEGAKFLENRSKLGVQVCAIAESNGYLRSGYNARPAINSETVDGGCALVDHVVV